MRDDDHRPQGAVQPDDGDELRHAAFAAGRRPHAAPAPEEIAAGDELTGDALSVLAAARREGTELLKRVHCMPLAIRGEAARGHVDERRAQRLAADRRPALVRARDDARDEVLALGRRLDEVEERLEAALQVTPERPGAVSAAFLRLGLVAGFAAAAMRLSAPVAAATVVGLSASLLAGLGPALNLIRIGDERGGAILTGATLATVLIAAVAAYAATVRKEFDVLRAEERARLALDHPAMGLLRRRDRLARGLEDARGRLDEARAELTALDGEIERLRRSSEATELRVVAAERSAVEAQVDLSGLEATTAAAAQERRAARAR